MKTFNLVRDSKYTTWWRDFYEVKAETLEEAVKIIINLELRPDPIYEDELDDSLERITPTENNGQITEEIFDRDDTQNSQEMIHSIWNDVTGFKPKPVK